jgi:hypothetical protein
LKDFRIRKVKELKKLEKNLFKRKKKRTMGKFTSKNRKFKKIITDFIRNQKILEKVKPLRWLKTH